MYSPYREFVSAPLGFMLGVELLRIEHNDGVLVDLELFPDLLVKRVVKIIVFPHLIR